MSEVPICALCEHRIFLWSYWIAQLPYHSFCAQLWLNPSAELFERHARWLDAMARAETEAKQIIQVIRATPEATPSPPASSPD